MADTTKKVRIKVAASAKDDGKTIQRTIDQLTKLHRLQRRIDNFGAVRVRVDARAASDSAALAKSQREVAGSTEAAAQAASKYRRNLTEAQRGLVRVARTAKSQRFTFQDGEGLL